MPSTTIRICVGTSPVIYKTRWQENQSPHRNEELIKELEALPGMDWVQVRRDEPILDIAASSHISPSGQYLLSKILDCFHRHGYELANNSQS